MPASKHRGPRAKVKSSLSRTPSVSQMGFSPALKTIKCKSRRLIGPERRELVDKLLAEVRGTALSSRKIVILAADQRVVEHGKAILSVRNVGHGSSLSE